MPLFSVIMPSYLGEYSRSAKDKIVKFRRAVDSVINQTFTDFELIIVSDGCIETKRQLLAMSREPGFAKVLQKVSGYSIPKQTLWSGIPRNCGINKAKGDFIIYLDTDDKYEPDYLLDLSNAIRETGGKDWYFVNDLRWDKKLRTFKVNRCSIERGRCGTSNIIHRRELGVLWDEKGKYDHDWMFINRLLKTSSDYEVLPVAGYQVCHLPNFYDV